MERSASFFERQGSSNKLDSPGTMRVPPLRRTMEPFCSGRNDTFCSPRSRTYLPESYRIELRHKIPEWKNGRTTHTSSPAVRTLYVGFTSDLFARVMQHRAGAYEGFTSKYNCNRLVWYERFGLPLQAIAREKQIKRWSRNEKLTLIERENLGWIDLAAEWGEPIIPFRSLE